MKLHRVHYCGGAGSVGDERAGVSKGARRPPVSNLRNRGLAAFNWTLSNRAGGGSSGSGKHGKLGTCEHLEMLLVEIRYFITNTYLLLTWIVIKNVLCIFEHLTLK